MTRTALYRHYDAAGSLLYVGITDCLSERDKQHRANAHWHGDVHRTETEWCLSRDHASALERVAIQFEGPLHNVAHVPGDAVITAPAGLPLASPAGETLGRALVAAKVTQRAFAKRIGIDYSVVSRFINGKATPALNTAVNIERETNGAVPASAWTASQYPVRPILSVGAV